MKIGICGNYGVSNVGDEAILLSLKTICKKLNPDAEIIVFGKGLLFPVGFRSFFRSLFKPDLWLKPLLELRSCNVFIIGGGGLFSDEEDVFIPLFWAFQGFIAVLFKKPLLCVGISIGRLNILNKVIVRGFLRHAKIIIVRDEASHRLISSWGRTVFKTSDLSLLINEPKTSQISSLSPSNKKKYIVISARSFKKSDDFLYKKLALFCAFVSSTYGLEIRLLPLQNGDRNDTLVLNKIFEQATSKEHIVIEKFSDDLDKVLRVISDAELVVAMRLHAGILSLVTGTPFIPIVYMEKVSDFWLGLSQIPTISITANLLDDLCNAFQRVYLNRREHRAIITSIKDELALEAKKTEALLIPFLKK